MKAIGLIGICISNLLCAPLALASDPNDEECELSNRLEEGTADGRVVSAYQSFEWATESGAVTNLYAPPTDPLEPVAALSYGERSRPAPNVPLCSGGGIVTPGRYVPGSNGVGGVKIAAPSEDENSMVITDQTGVRIDYVLQNAEQFMLAPVQIAEIDLGAGGSGQVVGISIKGEYGQVSVGAWLETPSGVQNLAFGSAPPNAHLSFALHWTDDRRKLSMQILGATQYGNPIVDVTRFKQINHVIFGSVRPTNSLSWYQAADSQIRMTRAVWIRPPTKLPVPVISSESFACSIEPQYACRTVAWNRPSYTYYYQTQNAPNAASLEGAHIQTTIHPSAEFRSGTVMRVRACGSTGICTVDWSPAFAVP